MHDSLTAKSAKPLFDPLIIKLPAQCHLCGTNLAFQLAMLPTVSLVFQWTSEVMLDDRPLVAGVVAHDLILVIKKGSERVFLSVPLGKEVPRIEDPTKLQKFELVQIYPGVIQVSQSIADPRIHAFVTVVGVPEGFDLKEANDRR